MRFIVRSNPLRIEEVAGFLPADFLCNAPLMPDNSVCTDASIINVFTQPNELGIIETFAEVDLIKLQAKLDAGAAAAQAAETRRLTMEARRLRIKQGYINMATLTMTELRDLLKDIILELRETILDEGN